MDDDVFSTVVLEKLPLAESVWRLLHYTMDEAWLVDLWDRNRGRCYERELKFSTLAHLVSDALLQHDGSGRKSFERAQEERILNVSIPSPYAKLATLPVALSEAFLEGGSRRMQAVLPEDLAVDPLPPCLEGYDVFGADGKAVKHVKRLLKSLRNLQAGILGARASVGLNLRTGLVVGMVGHLDGEAGEAALTEDLLPRLATAAARSGKPWVAVLDRLYCNLSFPRRVLDAGGHFLIRYCSNTTFVPDAKRPARAGRDSRGRRIVQEWGWLGKVEKGSRVYVRRITLDLGGGKSIGVVTDLLDEEEFPAEALLATYHGRWGIEEAFHQITEVFSLKRLIGTGPKAVLYQMSFCLLLYNALQVVRLHLASHQACAAEKISNEKLFDDVQRQMISVDELIEADVLLGMLGAVPSADELRSRLQERLGGVWSKRWWKAPSSGGGGHKKEKKRVLGNHTSTYRVLQQARE
ncbi:Transposase DDE domain protein [Aquisphaera giovannonii]|uniref:Transposase DDE domain protein n=1 Tax=Aquisphaera giovannonii TaxID=406548 RepID=A0A5B9W4T1_9BACT|nr:transposase [Aquisphaera giovannonii]QEH33079.1 Transposase DDE domain protein [Aquisphaera giovannonii]QEH35145.1 Transposase DDE domain protein [Aquisphaera giovannonii]